MNSNAIRFNKNGKLVIMQVSDPQDLVFVRKAMTKMLDEAYDRIKPDLVLFTGDNILGNHLLDARIGSKKVAEGWAATYDRMDKSLAHILKPLEERKIPFAMIYGNHDDMNCVTKDEQIKLYKNYSMCLPLNDSDNQRDCDTYNIPIYSNNGEKLLFNLWMLDSAWHDKETDKCFCEIKPAAVEWFKSENENLKSENEGNIVASLMFMHVPLPQQTELCKECDSNTVGALKLPDGRYITLDEEKAKGIMGEPPCVCDTDAGLFSAIKENGRVLAVVGGHDHLNCFDGCVDGVRFIQTPCASFRCYGNRMRGVRLFILDENNPDGFETKMLTYDDICGNDLTSLDGIKSQIRYFIDADELTKPKIAAGCAIVGALALGIAVKCIKKKKK